MTSKLLYLVAVIFPTVALCGGVDIYGTNITAETKLGYVDGDLTTVKDIADFGVPSDYEDVKSRANSALQSTNVVDNLSSTSATDPLSANQGRELEQQINNLKIRGRYLSIWNCTNGLAETTATVSPYEYKSGDYFIVGFVGVETNYCPSGSYYTNNVPSRAVQVGNVYVNDTYYYDGTVWSLLHTEHPSVTFGSLAGSPYDNNNLKTALDEKTTTNNVIGIVTRTNAPTYTAWSVGDVWHDGTTTISNMEIRVSAIGPECYWMMVCKVWEGGIEDEVLFKTKDVNTQDFSTKDSISISNVTYPQLTSSRSIVDGKNALGLARLVDLPSTNGFVTSSITNAVAEEVRGKFSSTGGDIKGISGQTIVTIKDKDGYDGVIIKSQITNSVAASIDLKATADAPSPTITLHDSTGSNAISRAEITIGTMNVRSTIETKTDTNDVCAIINAEVGGTNTLAHEGAGDNQIVRGDKSGGIWQIDVVRATGADNVSWSNVIGPPTTLEGYGITDALSANGGWTLNGDASFNGFMYLMNGWDYLKSTAENTQTLPSYLASGDWNTKTDTNKFLTVGGALAETDLWSESNAKLTNRIEVIATPIAADAVANANTTYRPQTSLVSLNQSVQYVVGNGSPLTILTPSSVADGTRDWLVYVNATADTALDLTNLGGVLVADAAYTNACAKDKVTMLCFTEMTNNVFVIGRQELTPVK